ncbi:MAG: hypothetical protein V2I27_08160 [Erythrobacter sp.]|nr:hypothetical protein [Erythrobacter sp.]
MAAQRAVSITHDPFERGGWPFSEDAEPRSDGSAGHAGADIAEELWVELLREGLTFDLAGLAPGRTNPFPAIRHRFDLDATPASAAFEGIQLVPGQHLAGGERSVPVVMGLIGLARDIVHHFEELAAVVWPPSASAIGRRYFESISTAWLDGGAFPALGLTAFRETEEGALQSEGLGFWIDQEIRIEPPVATDKVAATRLGVRLVNQLILVGGVEQAERIVAPDGTPLVMRPSRNGKFVQVWRE